MESFYYWGTSLAVGFLPGIIIGLLIWMLCKKSSPIPLYRADLVSFIVPLAVWFVMHKYNWTLVKTDHQPGCEVVLLGWIWSIAFIARMVIPRTTHKLRFRLAAIHVGSIALAAAVLLALFYAG